MSTSSMSNELTAQVAMPIGRLASPFSKLPSPLSSHRCSAAPWSTGSPNGWLLPQSVATDNEVTVAVDVAQLRSPMLLLALGKEMSWRWAFAGALVEEVASAGPGS